MKSRATLLATVALLTGVAGCDALVDMINTLVGEPEPVPTLGQEIADSSFTGGVTDWDDIGSESPLNPATGATTSDLAGIWVHSKGYGAIHINSSGSIYQVDLSDNFAGQPLPSYVPETLYDVGSATVDWNGQVNAHLSASLIGVTASATMSGLLDETLNIIFNVNSQTSIDTGSGPDYTYDSSPWYRWDADTNTYPGLQ